MFAEAYAGRGFEKRQKRVRNVKLFVFGDSYVDAGNCPRSGSVSWRQPYGITFPGKPYGRFSDGRVLTDYIGKQTLSVVVCINGAFVSKP